MGGREGAGAQDQERLMMYLKGQVRRGYIPGRGDGPQRQRDEIQCIVSGRLTRESRPVWPVWEGY